MSVTFTIRELRREDVPQAAALHERVLHMEFLARCGGPFLRRYYRAWATSPGGIAVVAVADDGDVVGALLGSHDPPGHVRAMLRGGAAGLLVRMVAHAVRHPRFGADLVATRFRRYVGGLWRMLTAAARRRATAGSPGDPPAEAGGAPRVGEITHLLVDPRCQGAGVGRSLVMQAMAEARRNGATELVLVTPPDLAARQFYERLGWEEDGEVTSRSGEAFVRYRLPLGTPAGPVDQRMDG